MDYANAQLNAQFGAMIRRPNWSDGCWLVPLSKNMYVWFCDKTAQITACHGTTFDSDSNYFRANDAPMDDWIKRYPTTEEKPEVKRIVEAQVITA